MSKVVSFSDLTTLSSRATKDGQTVVHVHGNFDVLHIGHIRFLKQAKSKGDILTVTISSDQSRTETDAVDAASRVEAIESLSTVDYVAIDTTDSVDDLLATLRPTTYMKGSEFDEPSDPEKKETVRHEQTVCDSLGIQLLFASHNLESGITDSLNTFFSSFSDEIKEYLRLFKTRYSIDDITDIVDSMSKLNVLVMGDTILDEYRYCHHLGTSSKDSILTVQHDSAEIFAGGILAIANHVSNFANKVDLLTTIGDKESYETFIRESLNDNVSPELVVREDCTTLRKIKYVDKHSLNKLFGVYMMDDSKIPDEQENAILSRLDEILPNYDLVIVGDFGHGAITSKIRHKLAEKAPFLAINTQANAGNRRVHTISRYPRANYISISESELRLDIRDFDRDIRPLCVNARDQFSCDKFVVTRGRRGSCIVDDRNAFSVVPAFNSTVIDVIGSGDAFFSVTAMLAYLKADSEMLGLIGNIVGALAVKIVGNKDSISKDSLIDYTTQLLS